MTENAGSRDLPRLSHDPGQTRKNGVILMLGETAETQDSLIEQHGNKNGVLMREYVSIKNIGEEQAQPDLTLRAGRGQIIFYTRKNSNGGVRENLSRPKPQRLYEICAIKNRNRTIIFILRPGRSLGALVP